MIPIKNDQDVLKAKERLIKELIEDQKIRTFLTKNQLPLKTVEEQLSAFNDYLNSEKLCDNCEGLKSCQQIIPGQKKALECLKPEGIIINKIINCPYAQYRDYQRYFIYNDIPEAYAALTLKQAEKGLKDKKLFVEVSKILMNERKQGLYLYGDFGVGKTYLCMALANSLAMQKKKVAFCKVTELIAYARKLIMNDQKAFNDLIESLAEVPYLILDDIGSETVSTFSRDNLLFPILDHRMDRSLTTIFTSNADEHKLLTIYQFDKDDKADITKAKRLMERIIKLADAYCLKGDNLRQDKKVEDNI